MKMTISVGRCLKRNTMLVWVMEYINKDLANCKSLRKVQELYTAFKKNTSRFKYWVLKVLWLEAQMLCSGWLKKDSLCLRLQLSSKCYVASLDWDLAYKDLIKKIIYNPESNKCIMHQCESCPGTATLRGFFDQELNEHEDD